MPSARQKPSRVALEEVREYAWNWFALHANQRMQTFNYFLIAMAFIATAYGTVISRAPEVAAGVATIGLVLSIAFHQLDERNRDLVKIGEAALKHVEEKLYEDTEWTEVRLVRKADESRGGFMPSFRWSIAVIEGTLALAFAVALVYAFYTASMTPNGCSSPRSATAQAVCQMPQRPSA